MTHDLDDWHEWVEHNPLRVWRKRNGMPILQTASALQCSMTSIQLWERGVHIPTMHMSVIGRLLDDVDIEMHWKEWKENQPTIDPREVSST